MKKLNKFFDIIIITLLCVCVVWSIISCEFSTAAAWLFSLLCAIGYFMTEKKLEKAICCYEQVLQANYGLTHLMEDNEDLRAENKKLQKTIKLMEENKK